MQKRILTFLAVCVLLSGAVFGVRAAGNYVVDNGDLLTDDEEAKLSQVLAQVADTHGIDIVVLTTDSLDGKSAMAYADDYYDYNGYGDDGVLLLVSMSKREWWVSTAGKCIPVIDSYSVERSILTDLSVGYYYDAFTAYADCCDQLMTAAVTATYPDKDDYFVNYDPSYDYDYDYDYSEEKPTLFQGIMICLVIGVVAGGIVVLILMSQLKSVRSQPGASSYVKPGSLHLSVSRDLFLYQNTTRRPKPKDNGSGGRSSGGGVHRSSSGRSHGGGGGRF